MAVLVADLLQENGYDVVLTRSQDTTCSLSERINKAHINNADVFFSIHANAGPLNLEGIETFFFDVKNIKKEVDCMDIKTRKKAMQTLSAWSLSSKELAQAVQESVIKMVKKVHPRVVNRGVKPGSCQVLMGFQGPAALIEAGYLTTELEGALLQTTDYQKEVAKGICKGIKIFVDKHFS